MPKRSILVVPVDVLLAALKVPAEAVLSGLRFDPETHSVKLCLVGVGIEVSDGYQPPFTLVRGDRGSPSDEANAKVQELAATIRSMEAIRRLRREDAAAAIK